MTDGSGLSAENNPPFGLDMRHPDVVADTIGGLSLARTLPELLEDEVATGLVAQTADPEDARRAVDESPFLRAMADGIVTETFSGLVLEPATAYRLGVYMAASTVEVTARQFGSYGVQAFVDDIGNRAHALNETGASEYREEDRVSVWAAAMQYLDGDARQRLAEMMMLELQQHVGGMSAAEAAGVAAAMMQRLGEAEGTDAGVQYNPLTQEYASVLQGEHGEAVVVTQGEDSVIVAGMVDLVGGEAPQEGAPEELYERGVVRTLAFVALGLQVVAGREPLPDIGPDAV
jgi:hypothetical protein